MGFTELWLKKILGEVQAQDDVLKETRKRRDVVLDAARRFEGALRVFGSGSVAHGTVIKPVSDADGGVVLDRRSYPDLGPDGASVGPREIVEKARDFILQLVLVEYPKATAKVTKRAIKFTFNAPVSSGEDPSVDLVIALTRESEPSLWIPDTETNSWDASHPERHTELLTSGAQGLRVLRARVIRLGKAWNKQYADPAISSFNIEALSLPSVKAERSLAKALAEFFAYSATDLVRRLTPDPAEVSPPIKCPDRDLAVRRLKTAAEALEEALQNDEDEEKVLSALSRVFWDFVEIDPASGSKEAVASAIRTGSVGMLGGAMSTKPAASKIKPVTSYGDEG